MVVTRPATMVRVNHRPVGVERVSTPLGSTAVNHSPTATFTRVAWVNQRQPRRICTSASSAPRRWRQAW